MDLNQLIEEWFIKHFHGLGPAMDVTTFNLCRAAKEDLLKQIAEVPAKKEK